MRRWQSGQLHKAVNLAGFPTLVQIQPGAHMNLEQQLKTLRSAGWMVAVHNDFRLNGKSYTFWLFTHSNGRWLKGEASTDIEALNECIKKLNNNSYESN